MYLKYAIPVILLMGLVFLMGCSGAGDIPVVPATGNDAPSVTEPFPPNHRGNEGGENGITHQLWGYYLIQVSEDHKSAEVIPMREVAQHFNALLWLETSPCTDCVKIVNVSFPGGGVIDYGVQLRHPFPGQLQYTGFDVRGIAIFNAHGTFPVHNLKYSIRETGDGEVVNPDGYSHLYHVDTFGSGANGLQGYIKGHMAGPVNPTGTLNAYKNFYSSENRHFFASGDAIEIHYLVDPPNGAFIFGYAVDACWALPQNKPVDEVPDDFGMNANSPEAYQVSVTLGEGLTSQGGAAQVEIWVYDWQGLSTIKSVKLEAPDLFASTVDATFDSMTSKYVIYKTSITNALGAAEGNYDVLIAVEDKANDSAPAYLDLTAYQIAVAKVGQGIPNQPPVAIAKADKTEIKQGEEVHFDGTDSYDPEDGPVSLYEWDLDGNGSFETAGFSTPSKIYDTPGDYYVDLKVWDSLNLTDTLDTKIHISVKTDPCIGHTPTANGVVNKNKPNVMEEIEFTDISTDPDGFGDLAFFEWDLDGDHTNGPKGDGYETFNKNPKWTYFEGGDYLVYHRVTDMANCVDVMDTPILVEANGPPVANAEADKYVIDVGTNVIFTSLSDDPDGNGPITKYEWDLDGDGELDSGVLGPVVDYTYYNVGTFNIQHKVTDSKGLTDTLDTPLKITVNPQPDVVVHLSEEHAMNPVGAKYIFHNYYGSIGGTSKINYLDYDGPWNFTTVAPNGVFYQNIVNKNDAAVSGYNSNWPQLQYYVYQDGPSCLDGSPTKGYGALARDYTIPPDDGKQYTYGIVEPGTGTIVVLNPYNVLNWPLDKTTNQYDAFSSNYVGMGLTLATEVWAQALGQGTAIVDLKGTPTPFHCLLLKVRQRDVWAEFSVTIADTVTYRWLADDGTEIAAITAMNAYMNPDNWNSLSGLITGNGCIRWLESFDLGG